MGSVPIRSPRQQPAATNTIVPKTDTGSLRRADIDGDRPRKIRCLPARQGWNLSCSILGDHRAERVLGYDEKAGTYVLLFSFTTASATCGCGKQVGVCAEA